MACQVPLPMEFSRQEFWVGRRSLLQEIFSTHGSNLSLLHCRQILYHLSHQYRANIICSMLIVGKLKQKKKKRNCKNNVGYIWNNLVKMTPAAAAAAAAAAAKSLQSCLTLCDPIDSSPPGSAVHGILQARTLEWVAISFSNAWKCL